MFASYINIKTDEQINLVKVQSYEISPTTRKDADKNEVTRKLSNTVALGYEFLLQRRITQNRDTDSCT